MNKLNVGTKAEPKWTAAELKQLEVLHESFSRSAIIFRQEHVVTIGNSYFLADIR